MTSELRTRLDSIASSFRSLHKLLLDHEKRIYEKTYGRLENPYQLLNLAMEDPQFAWLRALSGEMVHLDEVRLNRHGIAPQSLRLIGTRIRALVTPSGSLTAFQQHYDEARNEDPAIMLAHGALMQTLPPVPAVELFLSAGNEQDDKDPLPGAIRPGTLVPGFGDKGYYAFGAIDERALQSDVALKTMRYSNETVVDIASTAMTWSSDDTSLTLDPWSPVIVHAGTGKEIGRIPASDGVLVSLYLRQPELGGDPSMSNSDVADHDGWFQILDEETAGTGVAVWAMMAPAQTDLAIPQLAEHDAFLYVVAGNIDIDGVNVPDTRLALIRHPQDLGVRTNDDTMLLAILVKRGEIVTKAGSVAR